MVQKQQSKFGYKLLAIVVTIIVLAQVFTARGSDDPLFDPPPPPPVDTPDLKFPVASEEQINPGEKEGKRNMDLEDPANIKKTVEYDPEEGKFYFSEKIGETDIKNPTYLTEEEYRKLKSQQDETDYWRQRLDALSLFSQKPKLPDMKKEGIFDRLFGGNSISVKPQGNLDLTFGGNWQNMQNPMLPQRARKYGIFDFDMQMNVNLLAQVGDKLKLNISNNTMPTFGEQNMQKVEYTGGEDDIVKKVEAGNVSFPLKSSLLTGPLSLFGLKTQVQFGKLFVTGVLSQQRSQRKTVSLQGGAQTQTFEVKADDYEENRNFLLGQYFHDNYDRALENYPIINSQVVVTRVDVWVTNRTGATLNVRSMINFMDLAETNPYVPALRDNSYNNPRGLPDNRSNSLYAQLLQNPALRQQGSGVANIMGSLGLNPVQGTDYAVATMRQLNNNEFTFHPQLGYISLNTQVNADDIIGVAYRYTLNGEVHQVGEFAEDISPDSASAKVMYLKMLKSVSATPRLPIWNLMMKNIYNMGGFNVAKEDFRLNVIYQDPGGGEKRFLPEGPQSGVQLITLLNLDRLNPQNDPAPDGVFDFVEGVTINAQTGKIIFPKLEPFGSALKPAMGGDPRLEKKYLFQMLYDSTKTIARQFQQNNRFVLKGNYRGAGGGTEISLGGFNIPQGSVTVTAGGQRLNENVDFQVDYSRGSVRILNQGVLASGVPINVSFEDNATFGIVQQNFWGARFDYFSSENLTLGGTIMRLTERPYTQKVSFGDDPIKNTVLGLDAAYQSEFPALTKALDKLPFYSTSAPSLISLNGEVAGIFPGHQRFIDALDPEGSVRIDDFEGTNSSIDLRFPVNNWTLSSTPPDFPGANDTRGLSSNDQRAKLSWYMLEGTLVEGSMMPDNVASDTSMQDYWRQVQQKEVFAQRSCISGLCGLQTFDLGYYPTLRGPYNFNTRDAFNTDGSFVNTRNKWGGIQRALDNNSSDFEAQNVEYITFWLLDPFLYNNSNSGSLYFNLGNVSEDVLKDSRIAFENGTPFPKDLTKLDETQWGYTPSFQQQITRSFDNNPDARIVQDVGYDGLSDDEERSKFSNFLDQMEALGTLTPEAIFELRNDPASDNFSYFRGQQHDKFATRKGEALVRYMNFNGPHGNSPVASPNADFTNSGSGMPESEDINRDNSLNETESYFEYKVDLLPSTNPRMDVGQNYIVDKKITDITLPNGRVSRQTWYQFKIPITQYTKSVGGISDFRSIRFLRMYLTDFADTAYLRFAQLQLDRSQWRRYQYSLTSPGENIPEEDQQTTSFAVTAVSLEQNGDRQPIPYVMPPGLERQFSASTMSGQNLQDDEQSLALQVCGLKDGDSRAAFKQLTADMRQFNSLRMFIHAESVPNQDPLRDGDIRAFIRIGSDFINNYYEYQIPMKITAPLSTTRDLIWPKENNLDLEFSKLTSLKELRNANGAPSYLPYTQIDELGNYMVVVGNPNFGDVKNVMLGVLNPKKTLATPNDDGQRKCTEVWFNELRMVSPDEKPGYAAAGQASIQLADLGNVNLAASMHTEGYGNIDQKVDERYRDLFYTYNASTNLNVGRLLPKTLGIQLPVYAAYNQAVSTPKYDPYDRDILLSDKLAAYNDSRRDSIRKAAQDFTSFTSFNLANVRFMGNPEKQTKTPMPWSLKNIDLNYAFNRSFKRTPLLEMDELTDQKFGLNYNYSIKSKPFEPFKKRIKSKSKWWAPVKDFNINPLPSSFSFRTNMHRMFGETQIRNIDGGEYQIPSTFFKNFVWSRGYNLRWELTKSLSFNYTADNQSRIDEPEGRIDSREKRDSVVTAMLRLGRNTYYTQNLNAAYTVPTQKIPILDWTRLTVNYTSSYNWTAASRLAYEQGNIIANTNNIALNGELTFSQLYNKSRWLKAINAPKPKQKPEQSKPSFKDKNGKDDDKMSVQQEPKQPEPPKRTGQTLPPRPTRKPVDKNKIAGVDTMTPGAIKVAFKGLKKKERQRFRKELQAWKAKRRNIMPEVSDGLRFAGRMLTMVKRATVNYSETGGTTLPGFMDSTALLGVNYRSAQWYDFALGAQPGTAWFEQQAAQGRISRDSLFNGQLQQTYVQNFSAMATLEPLPSLRIDLTWNKQFNKSHSETFKYNETSNQHEHYSPYSTGMFNMTYIGIRGMFYGTENPTDLAADYLSFINNTRVLSNRLGKVNPYTAGLADPDNPEYSKGYSKYAQDVMIPAFLAAYTGRDASSIALIDNNNQSISSNPFRSYFPLPNWKLVYNGLSKLAPFNEYFSNFNLTHTYNGTLGMNSFISSFYYQDVLGVGFPSFIDSNSRNYVPFFQVPNITITETFGPLVGFDAALKNGLNFSVKFNKNKMSSLSLVDYQVSETKSTEIVVGGGGRIRGLTLPFTIMGVSQLKNDVNFNVAIGYRDDATTNTVIALDQKNVTMGQKVISISPTVDYIVNDNLQLRFFFDRRQSIPATTNSFPLTTTRAGVTLRFLFAGQ